MNSRNYLAILCAVASLLAFTGCASNQSETVNIEAVPETSVSETDDSTAKTAESNVSASVGKTTGVTVSGTAVSGSAVTKSSTQTTAKTIPASAYRSAGGSSNSSRGTSNNSASDENNTGDSSNNSGVEKNNSSGNSNGESQNNGNRASTNNASGGQSQNGSNNSNNTNSDNNSQNNQNNSNAVTSPAAEAPAVQTEAAPVQTEAPAAEEAARVMISLSDGGISSASSDGVSISGNVVTITKEGRYEFSGTLSDGQIVVNTTKEEKVDIYLNGVGITCSGSAPICVLSADTCTLHLEDGSSNYISDTTANEKSAAIFSKDDLTIKGGGALTVVGTKKHAIKSNNDVKVKNGTLSISAVSAGIYGEDSVQITGGTITVTSCKDGLKACDSVELDGFVTVEDGYLDVQNATGNGIQADVSITISGGAVNVHSAKKGLNCDNASYAEGCYAEY